MKGITVNPKVAFGKPCVAGTRIPIYMVLELVEAGLSFDQIVADYYPALTKEDIQNCIQYAINLVKNEDIHLMSEVSSAVPG
jgi:uncharacterized protein (DUF433 family)